jgi:hypothetical protein
MSLAMEAAEKDGPQVETGSAKGHKLQDESKKKRLFLPIDELLESMKFFGRDDLEKMQAVDRYFHDIIGAKMQQKQPDDNVALRDIKKMMITERTGKTFELLAKCVGREIERAFGTVEELGEYVAYVRKNAVISRLTLENVVIDADFLNGLDAALSGLKVTDCLHLDNVEAPAFSVAPAAFTCELVEKFFSLEAVHAQFAFMSPPSQNVGDSFVDILSQKGAASVVLGGDMSQLTNEAIIQFCLDNDKVLGKSQMRRLECRLNNAANKGEQFVEHFLKAHNECQNGHRLLLKVCWRRWAHEELLARLQQKHPGNAKRDGSSRTYLDFRSASGIRCIIGPIEHHGCFDLPIRRFRASEVDENNVFYD